MVANKPFKHRPLSLDKTQIRLFGLIPAEPDGTLAGIIAVHDFEHCPKYKAVSYTWGPPYPTREISLEGQSFTIRENLWQFLHVQRNYTADWLWIDQICIDQSTVDERNHQVSLMAEIYSKASWVLIWLGTEADGSNEAIDAINTSIISKYQELKVERLLGRPYWNRLWILQEILMGQAILVLCGNKSFHWENLENLFIPRDTRVDFGGLDRQLWKHPLNIRDVVLSLIEEKASFKGADGRLSYMLESFAGLQCEDVRDKVYGLLSLVRSSRVIPVDYSKTSTEVFFNAIRRIVKDESFMAIDSHFDVGQRLRDRMRLVDISDTEISDFVEKELGEVMKESELQQNMGDSDDQDMLLAAHNGDEVVIEQLLEKGVYQLYLDGKDSNGRSPLSWAAAKGNKASVKLLLDGAADINSEDNYGQTPLTRAALYGHETVVKLLVDEGAFLESKDIDFGWTPLSWAAKLGNEKVVMLLLEKGAHPEAKDSTDRTPLSWAADNGHEAVVKQLLEKGAHPETKDNAGRTPLSRAAEKGYETIVQLLESS